MTLLPGSHLSASFTFFGKCLRNLATRNFSAAKGKVKKFGYCDSKRGKKKLSLSSSKNQVLFLIDSPLLFRYNSDKLSYLFLDN